MKGIPNPERQRLGALLERLPQEAVMREIPQFQEAEIVASSAPLPPKPGALGVLVFNMERGTRLEELEEFLTDCPDIRPYDVILANELDDGCVRSGGRDTTREIANRLGLHAVFGLEFIELANGDDPKGFHGNAVFSRWPIRRAKILRLPEQYNWYHDSQRRIGGRCTVLAELDVHGERVGVASIHLENRTDGPGRQTQMEAVLRAVDEFFTDLPVVLGGDLNTNTFDGRDKAAISEIAGSPALQRRCLEEVPAWEGALPAAVRAGYTLLPPASSEQSDGSCRLPVSAEATRRKPLPDGGVLQLRLDWLLLRGLEGLESRTISTQTADCGFARPGSALARFSGTELSDHNAVWALCALKK